MIDEFLERGWWVSPPIVPGEVLDAAAAGAERYWAGEVCDGPPIPDYCLPVVPPPPGLRKNDYSSLRRPELMALVQVPEIAAIAAELMGTDEVRLWHDQLLYKPPCDDEVAANVGWHTDRSYWTSCTSDSMVTAWVPFHDVTVEHGALTMLDGSHRWDVEGRDDRSFFEQDLDGAERALAGAGRRVVKVPIEMKRGQVSFHHCKTFHGSGPNLTDEPRRSLAIHLQPKDNAYSGRGEHWNNALTAHDYTDPRYCPTLFRKSTAPVAVDYGKKRR